MTRPPDRNAQSSHNEFAKREVRGAVHVSGEVNTTLPTELLEEYKSSNKSSDRLEKKRFTLEKATFLFVAIVAVLSWVQTKEAIRSASATVVAANATALQANTSADQLEIAERPWVSLEPTIASPLWINENGANLDLSIRLRNSGLSPAIGTFAYPKFFPFVGTSQETESQKTKTCELATTSSENSDDDLYPGSETTQIRRFHWPKEELKANTREGFTIMQIVICVAYRNAFNKRAYSSAYSYDFYRLGPKMNGHFAFIADSDVPKEQLAMNRVVHFANIVDSPHYTTH